MPVVVWNRIATTGILYIHFCMWRQRLKFNRLAQNLKYLMMILRDKNTYKI